MSMPILKAEALVEWRPACASGRKQTECQRTKARPPMDMPWEAAPRASQAAKERAEHVKSNLLSVVAEIRGGHVQPSTSMRRTALFTAKLRY